mmetsp:Transcript_11379/g.16782  ORF Transcript_11379/g.16782 Transcript_11379/m.16782 type:complete len:82 (-) Transcript_11379:366-611(-)
MEDVKMEDADEGGKGSQDAGSDGDSSSGAGDSEVELDRTLLGQMVAAHVHGLVDSYGGRYNRAPPSALHRPVPDPCSDMET